MGGGGAQLQNLTGWQNCVLGMAAGAASKSINYPLLVCKNNIQQGVKTSFYPPLLYRGLPMAMVNMGGTTMVQFGSTGMFQKFLHKNVTHDEMKVRLGGAFLGGLASGVPCSVWELVMVQQQRFGGSLVGVPLKIAQEYGARGIFRGLTMTLGRESLFTLAMLGITPTIQSKLSQPNNPIVQMLGFQDGLESNSALAIGALLGSFFAAGLSHPMDTIKTCQQGDLAGEKFGSVNETFAVVKAEAGGFRGLFKGLSYRIGLISTTFFLVNTFKDLLVPVMFPQQADLIPM